MKKLLSISILFSSVCFGQTEKDKMPHSISAIGLDTSTLKIYNSCVWYPLYRNPCNKCIDINNTDSLEWNNDTLIVKTSRYNFVMVSISPKETKATKNK